MNYITNNFIIITPVCAFCVENWETGFNLWYCSSRTIYSSFIKELQQQKVRVRGCKIVIVVPTSGIFTLLYIPIYSLQDLRHVCFISMLILFHCCVIQPQLHLWTLGFSFHPWVNSLKSAWLPPWQYNTVLNWYLASINCWLHQGTGLNRQTGSAQESNSDTLGCKPSIVNLKSWYNYHCKR